MQNEKEELKNEELSEKSLKQVSGGVFARTDPNPEPEDWESSKATFLKGRKLR